MELGKKKKGLGNSFLKPNLFIVGRVSILLSTNLLFPLTNQVWVDTMKIRKKILLNTLLNLSWTKKYISYFDGILICEKQPLYLYFILQQNISYIYLSPVKQAFSDSIIYVLIRNQQDSLKFSFKLPTI